MLKSSFVGGMSNICSIFSICSSLMLSIFSMVVNEELIMMNIDDHTTHQILDFFFVELWPSGKASFS